MTRAIQWTAITFLTIWSLAAISHQDLVLQIESLDLQLKSNPTNSELLLKRGDLYRRHEDFSSSARDFSTVRTLDPENALLDFYVGRLSLDSGDAAAAEVHFEKYLDTHPQHSKAWMLRGETAIELQQPEVAANYFAQAIMATPSPSPALFRLQILSLIASGEEKWMETNQVVDQALARFGFEASLIGLGTDLALAENEVDRAGHYLDLVPPRLHSLEQWKIRIQTKECLSATDSEAQKGCLHQAKLRIDLIKNEFMGGR